MGIQTGISAHWAARIVIPLIGFGKIGTLITIGATGQVVYSDTASTTRIVNTLCDQATVLSDTSNSETEEDIWLRYVHQSGSENQTPDIQPGSTATGTVEAVACLAKHQLTGLEAKGANPRDLYVVGVDLGEAQQKGHVQNDANAVSAVTTSSASGIVPISNKDTKSSFDHSLARTLLKVELFTIGFSIILLGLASLGIRNLWKMLGGLINRRHICSIPASLESEHCKFDGRISVLGLDTARFTPNYQGELEEIQSFLGKSKVTFFRIRIADKSMNVFIQKSRPGCISTFFDSKLSVSKHKALLALSTTGAKLGQLVSTKPNKKLRDRLILQRYAVDLNPT